MAELPALPLWTDAYLADTGHLTTIEHGAYLLLLMAMWRAGGSLPNDDKRLMRFAHLNAGQWQRIRSTIMEFFNVEGDQIVQGRLTDELAFVRQHRAKQSNNARAKYRKNNNSPPAMGVPNVSQTAAPTPTPISNTSSLRSDVAAKPKKASRIPDDFRPDLEWATSQGLTSSQANTEASKFRDYWAGKGANATKTDWPATWRNWVRSALERMPRAGPMNGARTASDVLMNLSNEMKAADNVQQPSRSDFVPPRQLPRIAQRPGDGSEGLFDGGEGPDGHRRVPGR